MMPANSQSPGADVVLFPFGELKDAFVSGVSELLTKKDFYSTMFVCGGLRRVFFAAHWRVLTNDGGAPFDADDIKTILQQTDLALGVIATIHVAAGTVDATRLRGYERSICFRRDCLRILVDSGESAVFDRLYRESYAPGTPKPPTLPLTVESKLLRQLAHLQWELDHEKGPFKDAAHVFSEILRPYPLLFEKLSAKSEELIEIERAFLATMAHLTNAIQADQEEIARDQLRWAARCVRLLVTPRILADTGRAAREAADYEAVLANPAWLKEHKGRIVVVARIQENLDVIGHGIDQRSAWENARENARLSGFSLPAVESVTFVAVPEIPWSE